MSSSSPGLKISTDEEALWESGCGFAVPAGRMNDMPSLFEMSFSMQYCKWGSRFLLHLSSWPISIIMHTGLQVITFFMASEFT